MKGRIRTFLKDLLGTIALGATFVFLLFIVFGFGGFQ